MDSIFNIEVLTIADYFGVTVDYLINNSPVGSGKEDNHVACSYPNDYFLTREEAQETLNKNGGAEK